MKPMRASTLCLAVAATLCACGQRGELYLPTEVREPVVTVPVDPDEEDDADTVQPPAIGNPGGDVGTR